MLEALNEALAAMSLRGIELQEVRPLLGSPLLATMAGLLRHLGGPHSLTVELAERYRVAYRSSSIRHAATYPGIPAAVRALSAAGHTLAVVSSKPARYSVPLLTEVGLHSWFDAVYGPVGREDEPKARTLARAIASHGQSPAVMVGDTVADVVAAQQVGATVIAVLWGYGDRIDLAARRPDAIADNPSQLPSLLAQLR